MQNNSHTHDGIIRCPECSHEFPITEGILTEVKEGLTREFEIEKQALLERVKGRESDLEKREQKIEEQKALHEKSVAAAVAAKLKIIREEESLKASEKSVAVLEDLKIQVSDAKEALKEAKANELQLRKQQRELEEAREDLDLQVARKLDEERETIREKAARKAAEENQLQLAERDKKIGDLLKQVDEMKLKGEQGSVQLQGEVLELSIEEQLGETFPTDQISPVPKGMRGADVVQTVISPTGRECGSIIFETKRTKNWGADWIGKLKQDQLAANAQIPVIISKVLPEGIERFGQYEGVWVCDFTSAMSLASALRFTLIQVSREQLANEGRTEKAEVLYSYITGTEFRQRIEAIVDHFTQMREDLDSERRCAQRRWAKRDKQIFSIQDNIAMMFGSMEAIAGKALPSVSALEISDNSDTEQAA